MSHNIDLGVSLYGFTERFIKDNNYGFEEMFQDLDRMGVKNFEIVGPQMFSNYPVPPEKEIEEVLALCKKYEVTPFSYSGYIDIGKYSDHDMTDEEILHEFSMDLMTAKRLGCKFVKGSVPPSLDLLSKIAMLAEIYDIKVCHEIHSPHTPSDTYTQSFVKAFKEINSPYLGFIPDFGCFIERPNEMSIQRFVDLGAKRELLYFIIENRWKNGYTEETMREKIASMGGGETEKFAVSEWFGFMSFGPADLEGFKSIMPLVHYFHGKFYHIGEDCIETTIPYEKLIKIIVESGFKGTIMTEYEGHYYYLDDAVEQIGRHLQMEKTILESLDK